MWKAIVRVLIVVLIFAGILWLGGYKISEVSRRIELKSPSTVFNLNVPDLPGNDETLPSSMNGGNNDENPFGTANANNNDNGSNESGNTNETFPTTQQTEKAQFEYSQQYRLVIDGHEYSLGSTTTVGLIRFLNNNCDSNDTISCTPVSNNESSSEGTTSTSEGVTQVSANGKYLKNEEELEELVANIPVGELATNVDYNRTSFENPVKSYTYNGQTMNRNDYSWHTSSFLVSENPFKYTCPYTGMTVTNEDNLDYDHIVPLKFVYLRGGANWTAEQMNAYAYDQDVGIDVYYSANRSKADKGPTQWLPTVNVGSYCYSWLVICEKYNLTMTQAEIDLCTTKIQEAMANGETIEFLGGQ